MSDTLSPVTLPNTEIHFITSKHNDREYKLYIALPDGYANSEESYPVIYVTDAYWSFYKIYALVRSTGIPPVIIVGIGYPTEDAEEIQQRRLYEFSTPSPKYEQLAYEAVNYRFKSGGVADFTNFLCDELFTFIDSRYRSKANERIFRGFSAGGSLGVYLLFTRTDAFSRYIIGAPGLHWDDRICFKYEQEHAENSDDLPAKLYLFVGSIDESDWEPNASLLTKFHSNLSKRNYPNLDMKFEIFNGKDHFTANLPGSIAGLQFVFD